MTDRMTVVNKGWEVRIPAGTYFLGDPCYAVPDERWHDLLESCGYFDKSPVGVFVFKGTTYEVLAFSTAYGDGEYVDQRGHRYAVDAGMIGLTPVLEFPGWRYADNELEEMGQIVEFDHDVTASTDGEGRLTFGEFSIDTTDETDDDGRWS